MRYGSSVGLTDSMNHAGNAVYSPPDGTISPFRTHSPLHNVQQGGTERLDPELTEFFSPQARAIPSLAERRGDAFVGLRYPRRLQRSH